MVNLSYDFTWTTIIRKIQDKSPQNFMQAHINLVLEIAVSLYSGEGRTGASEMQKLPARRNLKTLM
jgi:hypothetical protein